GLTAGDRMILSLETSEETLTAIWAAFLGGIIPALVQSPRSFSEYNPAIEKTEKIFQILDNPYVLTSHWHPENWVLYRIPETNLINFSRLSAGGETPEIPAMKPDDLVLIQCSSGSTGDPKGIQLTHRNILANIRDIIEGIDLTQEDVSVSWMPLYHDMGLIGFHITPTMAGCQQYFIDPADFVKNPSLWLDTLTSKQGTVTGCPNFGQTLVNRYLRRKKRPQWDFSRLRVLFNGAEPISAGTMREFVSNLSPYGLQPASMFPAYGLAEATLAVTFAPLEKEAEVLRFQRTPLIRDGIAIVAEPEDEQVVELVNLGHPLAHCSVRVMGEDGVEVREGYIGSVQVQGDNVSPGYYHNEEATRQTFPNGWLHTGDLGFVRNGDLFIVGRLKEVIFINGINYYAHDLERVASAVEEIPPGKLIIAAYFDEKEGRDKLLVFLAGSDSERTRATFLNIKNHLKHTLGLHPYTFIPIRPNDIPRTSSGKIQRYKMVNRFLQGKYRVVKL
ncbi:MAG: AMP-binding protein, partial [Bacteroidota bacterium]